jgi:putative FmdB family regulatory protein
MPIYEYACLACGVQFEQFLQTPAAVVCRACQSDRVSRRLSVVGIRTGGRPSDAPAASMGGGGGCCGGGCGCH